MSGTLALSSLLNVFQANKSMTVFPTQRPTRKPSKSSLYSVTLVRFPSFLLTIRRSTSSVSSVSISRSYRFHIVVTCSVVACINRCKRSSSRYVRVTRAHECASWTTTGSPMSELGLDRRKRRDELGQIK
jgi:hypothetical protein